MTGAPWQFALDQREDLVAIHDETAANRPLSQTECCHMTVPSRSTPSLVMHSSKLVVSIPG